MLDEKPSKHDLEWLAFVERRKLSDARDYRQLFMFIAVSATAFIFGWSVESWVILLAALWVMELLHIKFS